MKKILLMSSLFLLFSCGRIQEEMVVTNVHEFKKGKYSIELNSDDYFITDSLYRVGDTLKISKK
jgi:hypothetical protein